MRHQVDHRKLGRHTSHRKALFRNMATSLILAERVKTTLPKAKELRRVADRLVTFAKGGTLHDRRQAARIVLNNEALKKLFSELAERFKDRNGGYTRIYHMGFRAGDTADMAAIEYLGYKLPVKEKESEDLEEAEEQSKEKAKAKKAAAKKTKAPKKEASDKEAKAPKAKKPKAAAKKEEGEEKGSRWNVFKKKGKKDAE